MMKKGKSVKVTIKEIDFINIRMNAMDEYRRAKGREDMGKAYLKSVLKKLSEYGINLSIEGNEVTYGDDSPSNATGS